MICSSFNLKRLARLFGLVALSMPLGGCHVLMVFPCLALVCRLTVSSLPPRDNPLSLALGHATDIEKIESALTAAVRKQDGTLGSQWPAPGCVQFAAVGCRYSIATETSRQEGFSSKSRGCGLLDVAVYDSPEGPVVRRLGYRTMPCPDSRSRPFQFAE